MTAWDVKGLPLLGFVDFGNIQFQGGKYHGNLRVPTTTMVIFIIPLITWICLFKVIFVNGFGSHGMKITMKLTTIWEHAILGSRFPKKHPTYANKKSGKWFAWELGIPKNEKT